MSLKDHDLLQDTRYQLIQSESTDPREVDGSVE